ncbi:hypothetical protein QOZ80_1BG0064710 [Eleusine coracana subsp. coracana]|nr:hypothetical protein QOZ80_1BG0064710 [Eleusine coracana subsp. coracana]
MMEQVLHGRAKKAKVGASAAVHPVPVKQECDAHFACGACYAVGLPSKKCFICGLDYSRSPVAEYFVLSGTTPCPYESYGCGSHVPYCDLDDHQRRACPFAPCCCPEQGCPFVGSPAMLIDHIAAAHSGHHRPLVSARYGHELELTLSAALRWRALVGPDRSLFVVSLGSSGQEAAVSVVCVRANAAAGVAPQYRCQLGVKVWGGGDHDDEDDDDGHHQVVVMEYKVCSSALPAERAGPDERAFMGLYHHLPLHQTVALSIRIDLLQSAAPTAAVTTPGKPSPATTPGARSSSRMQH